MLCSPLILQGGQLQKKSHQRPRGPFSHSPNKTPGVAMHHLTWIPMHAHAQPATFQFSCAFNVWPLTPLPPSSLHLFFHLSCLFKFILAFPFCQDLPFQPSYSLRALPAGTLQRDSYANMMQLRNDLVTSL